MVWQRKNKHTKLVNVTKQVQQIQKVSKSYKDITNKQLQQMSHTVTQRFRKVTTS